MCSEECFSSTNDLLNIFLCEKVFHWRSMPRTLLTCSRHVFRTKTILRVAFPTKTIPEWLRFLIGNVFLWKIIRKECASFRRESSRSKNKVCTQAVFLYEICFPWNSPCRVLPLAPPPTPNKSCNELSTQQSCWQESVWAKPVLTWEREARSLLRKNNTQLKQQQSSSS